MHHVLSLRCSLLAVAHPLRLHLRNGQRRPARHERTVRLSRLVSSHALILCAARNATRLAPGMAPVLLADAGSLATSCMHTHKSAPIAALPRRVPHPRNCHPSALEVIHRRPQEPSSPPRFAPGTPPTRVPPFYALLTTVALRMPQCDARAR